MTLVLDPASVVVGALGCAGSQGLLVLVVAVVMVVLRRHDRGVYPPGPPRVVK